MSLGTILQPMLGRHLTACTIQECAVSTAGVVTLTGSPVAILAAHKSLVVNNSPQREEINSSNSVRMNEVILADSESMSIEIFQVNDGADPAPIITQWLAADYLQIAWTQGTVTGSIQTQKFTGVRGAIKIGAEGRGEQVCTLELGPIDLGTAQYTRVLS